ncbi:MAG: right-handed parallel beta-helix repeat-containing protein [Anaerolineae bacterium]
MKPTLLLMAVVSLALVSCADDPPRTATPGATRVITAAPTPTEVPSRSPSPTAAPPTPGPIFHVAVNGNDAYPGTADRPFATIQRARDVIRTISPAMQSDIVVNVHGGVYSIRRPIQFTPADSGQNGYEIIYQAAEGEAPLLSGGVEVTGWEKAPDRPWWGTGLPRVGAFRQLYINGVRARRAASPGPITGVGWAAGEFSDRDGIIVPAAALPNLARPQDLELHWIYDWKDMRLPAWDVEGKADGAHTIWMKQPYFSHALWMGAVNDNAYAWYPKYDVPFYLENALEFLDKPGEWYYDADTAALYYLLRDGEDLRTAYTVIPQAQTLLEITGGMVGQEVHDLAFDGLTFAYAGWTRASEQGVFGWQAQNLIFWTGEAGAEDEYAEEMTPAHVLLNSARDIRFERCRFEHLGAAGIHLNNNVHHVTLQGNLFHDIADGAVVIGHWDHVTISDPATQAAAHDNLIANNLITGIGVEYWGAPAITAYYVNHVQIAHNEIANIPFTGVSVGWGWSSAPDSTTSHDNHVTNNVITDLMQRARDGGGVYTLGQQPGMMIEGNVVRRMQGDFGCYYADEGSSSITFQNNVCDTAPGWLDMWIDTVHDNHVLNSYTNVQAMRNNGVNIQIENTVYVDGQAWPPAAQAIIDHAGLESAYAYLHDWFNP